MSINLYVEPNTPPMSWIEFCKRTGPFSIAIDGYVNEGPITGDPTPRLNLNHHEGVDRISTRASCAQALMLIKNGVMKVFRDEHGETCINIYSNDCDQDVCATIFLFQYGYMSRFAINPLLHRLIDMVDKLDTTAGAYPFPTDLPSLQQMAWVFEPYSIFRLNHGLDRRIPSEFLSVIASVGLRIKEHILGGGDSLPLDIRYERIGGGNGWTMVREIGAQAYNGLAEDGINCFVNVRNRSDGKWTYTISRSLVIFPFDIPRILRRLNEIEGCTDNCWGGGNTIGGSPRATGSSLSPNEVERIINELLSKKK